MKRLLMPILIILAVFLSACNAQSGNGDVVTRDYDVTDFDKIDLSLSGEVNVTVGDSDSVSLSTDSNIHDVLKIEVRNGTLHLGLQNNTMISNPTEMIFTISVPELTAVTVSGSGEVNIDQVETEDFAINISGSGEVDIDEVETDAIVVDISGSGTVSLDGETQTLDVSVSGSGDLEAFDLEANDVTVSISGSGNIQVNADDSLTGSINGSGDVAYRGNADESININGSGTVERDN